MKIFNTKQFIETLDTHITAARIPSLNTVRFGCDKGPPPIRVLDALMRSWTQQVQARKALALEVTRMCDLKKTDDSRLASAGERLRSVARRSRIEHCTRYLTQAVAPYLKQGKDDNHIAGAQVVVDIDEAVHGSYAGIKDVNSIAKEGTGAVAQEYQLQALEWQTEPLKAIQQSVIPDTVADLVVNVAVGAPLGYLALKATMEGVESFQHSVENGRKLSQRARQVDDRLNTSTTARAALAKSQAPAEQSIKRLLARQIVHDTQQHTDIKIARKNNNLSGQIGIASSVSGLSIMAKVATTVGMQSGFSIAGGSVNGAAPLVAQTAAAATAATVAGTASIMVLSPLAAAGAIGLGALFTKKSIGQRKEFLKRFESVKAHLAKQQRPDVGVNEATQSSLEQHAAFFLKKGKQREHFYKHFVNMNKGFLAGSSIYGAGAVGTTVLSGLMLSGAAALLSNPVGWGILTGLGTIGGVIMAANSLQFLHGHQRQHRYDEYLERDDPELDREFLATLDIIAPVAADIGNRPESRLQSQHRTGSEMRAHFYQQISQREDRRRDFLRKAADDMGKWQKRKIYSTDGGVQNGDFLKRITRQRTTDQTVAKKTRYRPSPMRRLHATTWQRAKGFAQGFYPYRTFNKAADASRHAANASTDRLTSLDLQAWLANADHFDDQADLMLRTLKEQRCYLQRKVELKLAICEQVSATNVQLGPDADADNGAPEIATASTPELAAAKATVAFLDRLDRGLERDQILLVELLLLEAEIEDQIQASRNKTLFTSNDMDQRNQSDSKVESVLALAKERFMCLQTGYPFDPEIKSVNITTTNEKFANFIRKGGAAEERHKHLRGMMVDLEMQAAEVRKLNTLSTSAE